MMDIIWVFLIIITILIAQSPELILAVLAIFSALSAILISFTTWQKDRGILKFLMAENDDREDEIKVVKKEMMEELKNHALENDRSVEHLYEKIDKSNKEISMEIKKIMWYLTNSKITIKGNDEKERG